MDILLRRFLLQKHRRMNKFVLQGNRYTVVTRFVNLDFVRIENEAKLGTRLLSKTFLSEQANFSASERLGRNFPTVQNSLEKRKNLYLIKLVLRWKRAIRANELFGFSFLGFEVGANRLGIKFSIR